MPASMAVQYSPTVLTPGRSVIVVPLFFSLQAARGIAALIIVGGHILCMGFHPAAGEPRFTVLSHLGEVGYDLFFVLSGFSLIASERYQFGMKGQMWTFLKRRFFRIYPLYWVYFLAVFVVLRMEPDMSLRSASDALDFVRAFLLLPQPTSALLTPAWPLVQLMWCYLILALLLRVSCRRLVQALLGWGAITLYALTRLPPPDNAYLRVMVHASSLEFIWGALAGVAYLKLLKFLPRTTLAEPLILALGAGGIGYAWSSGVVDHASVASFMPWSRAMGVGAGVAFLLLFFALQESKGNVKVPRALVEIGGMSYSLLLSCIFTLSLCNGAWQRSGSGEGPYWQAGLWGGIFFVLVMLMAVFCFFLVEKRLASYCARPRTTPFVHRQ
ncbi:acyltransferase [Pseudomonas sp. ITA]|uniref:acyltransferase family protein n=1 Tax=Pseudomonas sp. ITA TaxID=2825841 RepID=UPI002498B7E4|nr:acyltransferase [Pseudomonas sp. ITA]MDI2145880.1 acyltransferase [Pseudomonas sp. ITA]